jgi:magnesium chelatase family protein
MMEMLQRELARLDRLLDHNHTLNGSILWGMEGRSVEIQSRATQRLSKPLPLTKAISVIGLGKGALREALKRLAGAFAKLGITTSSVRILVNLAPADLPKDGTSLDLPLAIAILQAAGHLPDLKDGKEGDFLMFGELSIHGEVRRVRGALALAWCAVPGQHLIVPAGNEKECSLLLAKHPSCSIHPVSDLEHVIEFFRGERTLEHSAQGELRYVPAEQNVPDFGVIRGQDAAREAALISAAGGHNLLLIGPPGEGKSLLASAMPGILPRLSQTEKVELTRIYSACGKLAHDSQAITRRAMRPVHHTASKASLVGGGSGIPQGGEITLAHLGVLFLDEPHAPAAITVPPGAAALRRRWIGTWGSSLGRS